MRTAAANFNTYNDVLTKNPVFAISFEVITGLGTFGLRTVYVSNTFADIGSPPAGTTFKKYLKNVNVIFPSVDTFSPEIIPGQIIFELTDKDGEVTTLLNSLDSLNLNIYAQTVTAKLGYQENNYADFINILSGLVTKVELDSDQTTWRITAKDELFQLANPVFGNLAINSSSGGILAADASIVLGNAVGFINPTYFFSNADARVLACIKVDEELITYTSINYGTNTISGLTRGCGGTTAADHATGSEIVQGIAFYCDPLRTLLHILTTSNVIVSASKNGDYDLGAPATDGTPSTYAYNIGLGITSTLINITNIERIGWKLFHAAEYNTLGYFFAFRKYDNALEMINEVLLKPHNLYLKAGFANWEQAGTHPDDAGGLIDVGMMDWVDWKENFSSAFSFADSNINNISYEGLEEEIKTQIQFEFGHNHASNDYSTTLNLAIPEVTYGPNKREILKHPGLDPANDRDQIELMLTYRHMQNFDMPTLISFDSQFRASRVEPGDRVQLSRSNLPNLSDATRTWTNKKCLINENTIDGIGGKIHFKARTWDNMTWIQDTLSGLYTINKIAEGSITDKTLAVSADATATTEAADAYYDNSGTTHTADRIIFFIRITPPNFAGGSDFETITLKISTLTVTPTIINSETKDYIRFNPKDSAAFTIELDLISKNDAGDTPDRVKVDWISTTAAGGEVPTVEFIGVWFVVANTKYA